MKACPICGFPVEYTCFHDGDDVQSEEFTKEEVIRLLEGSYEHAKSMARSYKKALEWVKENT